MTPEGKISPDDLREALALGDVLEQFEHLPADARRNFQDWIDKARDEEAHWRRIDLLVMAMRSAPRLLALDDPTHASEVARRRMDPTEPASPTELH